MNNYYLKKVYEAMIQMTEQEIENITKTEIITEKGSGNILDEFEFVRMLSEDLKKSDDTLLSFPKDYYLGVLSQFLMLLAESCRHDKDNVHVSIGDMNSIENNSNNKITDTINVKTMRTVLIEQVITAKGVRYQILDADTKTLLDNAQGAGFKSEDKAASYAEAHGWVIINSFTINSTSLF